MNMNWGHSNFQGQPTSRRQFLKTSAVASAALAMPAILSRNAGAAENGETLRIGLIGCGGRGTGAASQALQADPNTVLVALADAFPEPVAKSLDSLQKQKAIADRVKVPPEKQFVGLDAYQKLIDSGVDVVLQGAPPGFRPAHVRAAVIAGKHQFVEKPIATDAVGVRSVLESARMAAEKKLAWVAGLCWRYDTARREFFQQIHSGAIGDIRAIYATYLTGPVKPMPPASQRPAGMGDVEWQLRHWYNFVWVCGDGLVEQAVHSVDKVMWAMQDVPPLKAVASGGRQTPNNEGNIFDHINVVYEWEGGVRAFLGQRQISGCFNENSDFLMGSTGQGIIDGRGPRITGAQTWRFRGQPNNMYQTEHDELFASIRSGKPINDGIWEANSTLAGIMGRMAAYTGQEITWEMMQNSQEQLVPETLDWKTPLPVAPMAMPGRTKFV
ncbi:MAG TPA: Gfo/Idh/MocA family oxidoreductase [Verrucomicrobiota bacterium]|jgi:predicted dehydrogenase|nr:MAG: putative 4,5-dihydroxyphthalate dehydrogenase [Verrucomicrobia bacterium ADurb.Bin118]HPY30962.1 Gfo/Idh/MocA family oxidoreductase [Verrucomicrobiota bacterium]HQB17425.1 Gfo/Idh/MocA family oxidoreductase [Verrucomicrobiota bacterium]